LAIGSNLDYDLQARLAEIAIFATVPKPAPQAGLLVIHDYIKDPCQSTQQSLKGMVALLYFC
jgi:hypothetical protein